MKKSELQHSLPEYYAFRAVMLAGTTVGAARQLGISQSAVSRSVANLESKLGQTLFDREAGRLTPTGSAVRLNRRLDPLFEALRRIDGPTEPVRENLAPDRAPDLCASVSGVVHQQLSEDAPGFSRQFRSEHIRRGDARRHGGSV